MICPGFQWFSSPISASNTASYPEGVILTGGGAKMRDIEIFAKHALEAAVKVGIPQGLGGVSEAVAKPEYAVAVGLALLAAEDSRYQSSTTKKSKKPLNLPKIPNLFKKFFSKF